MATFQVFMKELGEDGVVREIRQTAVCESEQQVISFYGLNEPDILSYEIKQVN